MIMKKLLLLFPLLLSCLWGIAADEFRVAELRCEYRDNPLAINTLTPQFSWQTLSVGRGFLQAGYQIQVASDPADLARGRKLLWDEQRKSDVSLHVRYAGRTLKPGQRYYWRVRVSDAAGNYSPWSEIRSFAVGLLGGSDWDGARWIAFEELPDSLRVVPGQEFNKIKIGDRKTALNRLPQFRREVKVTKPVDKVYNGKEQKFVPVVTDGEKVLVENVDYVVTYTDALDFEGDAAAKDDFINVTGDIFVTVEGIGNYTGSLTQSYQITPKPYTVTTVSGSKVYDGTPLEGASLEGNFVGGLVNNDDATFAVTGTQTEVGASDNTYTLEFVGEQMSKNYKLVKEDIGTLTVMKDESEASQNSNGNGESKNKGTLPKTGDMTLTTLPFALAVVAGAVLCAAPVARRRSKF